MHENFKYLEAGGKFLKTMLLDDIGRSTVFQTILSNWNCPKELYIEAPHGLFRRLTSTSENLKWNLIYRQLWIFALRNFADIGGRGPLKEDGKDKYRTTTDPNLKFQFGKLARKSGVETDKVTEYFRNDPRHEHVRVSIAHVTNSCALPSRPVTVQKLLDEIPIEPERYTSDYNDSYDTSLPTFDLSRRWGVPFENAYLIGKNELFLSMILQSDPPDQEDLLNDPFIFRDFITSFFGQPTDNAFSTLVRPLESTESKNTSTSIASPSSEIINNNDTVMVDPEMIAKASVGENVNEVNIASAPRSQSHVPVGISVIFDEPMFTLNTSIETQPINSPSSSTIINTQPSLDSDRPSYQRQPIYSDHERSNSQLPASPPRSPLPLVSQQSTLEQLVQHSPRSNTDSMPASMALNIYMRKSANRLASSSEWQAKSDLFRRTRHSWSFLKEG